MKKKWIPFAVLLAALITLRSNRMATEKRLTIKIRPMEMAKPKTIEDKHWIRQVF
ncbi:hypothetical protein [Cohnella candidum]|uniref:hypothetical protein n=1 Tax=Cohnella candidum TaxID=2674991 RepID=UPI0013DE32D6|nr:hypothetical protein [Cohnella candidum]